jgi:hypothetical protein
MGGVLNKKLTATLLRDDFADRMLHFAVHTMIPDAHALVAATHTQ